MKKTLQLSVVWICLTIMSCTNYCWGQLASQELNHPQEKGKNVLLRTVNGNWGNFMYYQWENNNYFLYTRHRMFQYDYTPLKFPLPTINSIPYGQVLYTIKDMQIIGNKFVCCGEMRTPIGEEVISGNRSTIYESSGFIGWGDLENAFGFFHTIRFRMVKVNGTSDLRKLDVRIDTDTLVALIGTTDQYNSTNCLVAMHKNEGQDRYCVIELTNSLEQLTDVVFTEGMVVSVSRFYDEHRSFGLRGGAITDIFNSLPDISDYKILQKYNTPDTFEYCRSRDSWHSTNAEIKIVAAPEKNIVTVGYDTYEHGMVAGMPNIYKAIELYQIVIDNNYYLQKVIDVTIPPEDRDNLVDMMYDPTDATILLLFSYDNPIYLYGSLSKVSFQTGESREIIFLGGFPMSMDMPAGGTDGIWIGGAYQNNSTLFQTWQSFQYTYTVGDETYWETCFANNKKNTCDLTPLPELSPIDGGVSCHDGMDIDWRIYILNAEACETDTVCNDIYETKQ